MGACVPCRRWQGALLCSGEKEACGSGDGEGWLVVAMELERRREHGVRPCFPKNVASTISCTLVLVLWGVGSLAHAGLAKYLRPESIAENESDLVYE